MKKIENMNYSEYRKHLEEIAYQKAKILKIQQEKREAHGKYREFYRLFAEKTKEYDDEVQKLMDILPSKI